jgi:two-component system NtrC family response regulator
LGKFQQANGGTLFLDEIGDLPLTLQVKLLRALQEKQIEPVGAARAVRIDVRLLTATHKPVAEMSKQGLFREDLFYRVAEIKLKIPPLRERPRDISLLAQYFLQRFAKDKVITRDGLAWLESQLWPGNVRELMSAVKRAGLLSRRNDLGIADFMVGHPSIESSVSSGWLGGPDLESAKNKFVHDKVREALARSGGKRNLAAELLSITPRTLFRYLVEMKEMTDLSSSTDPDVMSDLTSGADSTIY